MTFGIFLILLILSTGMWIATSYRGTTLPFTGFIHSLFSGDFNMHTEKQVDRSPNN